MCKGATAEKSNNQGDFYKLSPDFAVTCAVMKSCELCGSRASLYCHADNAYLCTKCDQWVHQANFLAQRHVRSFLCNTCQKPTKRRRVGISSEALLRCHVAERSQCNEDDAADSPPAKKTFLFL